ncbi:MAG: adenine phosphoribosyltransferase [Myxococcota bacterium]|nr:adenine phosphoribosyltransferase [Myxococcota bacterium]
MNLNDYIRDVPDFPKPGIVFKDITPLLAAPDALNLAIEAMCERAGQLGATKILGIESRGFIFGAPMACRMGLPFILARKPGKLPYEKVSIEYALEYGTDTLEMHVDSVESGDRVAVVDDLLATGGTAEAVCKLIEQQGAEVAGLVVAIELDFLNGTQRLAPRPVSSLLKY